MKYISVKEAGEKWGLKERRVRALCQEGKVPDVMRSGRNWLIPADAVKPLVGRSAKNEIIDEKLDLYLNPLYCQKNPPEVCTEIDYIMCDAIDLYLQGCFDEAASKFKEILDMKPADNYIALAYINLYVIYLNTGVSKFQLAALVVKARKYLHNNENLFYINKFVSIFYKEKDCFSDMHLLPEKYIPIFTLSMLENNIMDALAGRSKLDLSQAELLSRLVNEEDSPVLALHIHVILALYTNLMGPKNLYDYHVSKALSIALPHKWYTPLAMYSYTLTWKEAMTIDPTAYEEINSLSTLVIDNYIKAGYFNKALPKLKDVTTEEIKTAFMIANGKSNIEIATELNITLYKVKSLVKKLYCVAKCDNREDLSEFVRAQFKLLF